MDGSTSAVRPLEREDEYWARTGENPCSVERDSLFSGRGNRSGERWNWALIGASGSPGTLRFRGISLHFPYGSGILRPETGSHQTPPTAN